MAAMTNDVDKTPLDQLREWGYRVEMAQEHEGFSVYFVDGFGMATYVRDDDEAAMKSLADIDLHVERELQVDETGEETQLRWHEDPDNEFELGEEQAESLRASVAAMKEAQSKEE